MTIEKFRMTVFRAVAKHLSFMGTYLDVNRLGKAGLTATLFFIGISLTAKTL